MGKKLFIAEKPSVAREFAKVFSEKMTNHDGYMESQSIIVTWCVGHLVTMSYPEAYDEKYAKWRLDTLPFLPKEFKYEVIKSSKKQFDIVSELLNRADVSRIYVCTDSGREGEYIYRLVRQEAHVHDKEERRVWIDSQTEEEIRRGIREAKDISAYDHLADAAYLRAKEDYLMGINFSRLLTLRYGNAMAAFFHERYAVISVGRVMTCVLGMVVRREREIRSFQKTPFYRVVAEVNSENVDRPSALAIPSADHTGLQKTNIQSPETAGHPDMQKANNHPPASADHSDLQKNLTVSSASPLLTAEWKAVEGSHYYESPLLYKENGFREKKNAIGLLQYLWKKSGESEQKLFSEILTGNHSENSKSAVSVNASDRTEEKHADNYEMPLTGTVTAISKKKEKKNPPLLYNLAELQSDCSKLFKISPDQTLDIIQELYEKKLVTYPRTDARVLSTAVAKEIDKNVRGLENLSWARPITDYILKNGRYKGIEKTRYTNDKKITDHYAVIPTGQGMSALKSLKPLSAHVYEIIVRRFLAIFLSPAEYLKVSVTVDVEGEKFFASGKYLENNGYLGMMQYSFTRKSTSVDAGKNNSNNVQTSVNEGNNLIPISMNEGNNPIPISVNEGNNPIPASVKSDHDSLASSETGKFFFQSLRKGSKVHFSSFGIREGETSPPKRYNSGSMILAMENAGQLIEDEELREQIKSQGIGTSATRAEILAKLVRNRYLNLNKKTQIITPTLSGEIIYDIVYGSIRSLLDPKLTASWEKGLNMVSEGEISPDEYMAKLEGFIRRRTDYVKRHGTQAGLQQVFRNDAQYYEKELKSRIARGDRQKSRNMSKGSRRKKASTNLK